jgi:splicing factor 3B subunit 3
VFTLRAQPDDDQDGFIVVSFANATLVFEIGEEVKETSQSGFLATVATLHTQLLEDGSILQVGNCTACTAGRLWIGQPAPDAST